MQANNTDKFADCGRSLSDTMLSHVNCSRCRSDTMVVALPIATYSRMPLLSTAAQSAHVRCPCFRILAKFDARRLCSKASTHTHTHTHQNTHTGTDIKVKHHASAIQKHAKKACTFETAFIVNSKLAAAVLPHSHVHVYANNFHEAAILRSWLRLLIWLAAHHTCSECKVLDCKGCEFFE